MCIYTYIYIYIYTYVIHMYITYDVYIYLCIYLQELLAKMKKEFDGNLADAIKTEAEALASYEKLKDLSTDERDPDPESIYLL